MTVFGLVCSMLKPLAWNRYTPRSVRTPHSSVSCADAIDGTARAPARASAADTGSCFLRATMFCLVDFMVVLHLPYQGSVWITAHPGFRRSFRYFMKRKMETKTFIRVA